MSEKSQSIKEKPFVLTESKIEKINDAIIEVKDTFSELRKKGKDPFMQVVDLKELVNFWRLAQVDPNKESFEEVKKHLKKIKLELKQLAKEKVENLVREYNKKEDEEE